MAILPMPLALMAQAPPPPPPGQIDPGLQRERLEQLQRQREIEERARRTQVPALQGEAAPSDTVVDQGEAFVLRTIQFTPSRFLEAAALEALARPFVGREVRLGELDPLIASINQLYEQAGQLTARAIIPPQTVGDDGVLRILLVEATVDQVSWQGEEPRRVDDEFYRARLQLEEGQVLDSRALIETIEAFNATTSGPQVTANLAPGRRFGTSRIDLEAYEPPAWQWTAFVNNYGNEGSGREQYGGSVTWFAPTGTADALTALVVATSGSTYGSLRYSRPVTRRNGVAYAEIGANTLQIKEGPFAELDIEGDSQVYGLGFDQPWWMSRNWLLRSGVGYTMQQSETTIDGVPLSSVQTSEFFLSGTAEYRGTPWYVRYDQRIRQASADNDLSGTDSSHALFGGSGYASRMLSEGRYELIARFGWQVASDPETLPASLYYQFGGIGSIRGYDAGVLSAPKGMSLNLEGHWRFSQRWQAFVFYDQGRAMELGTQDVDLRSAGVGLNLNWNSRFSANLVFASALEEVVPDQNGAQALLQIVVR